MLGAEVMRRFALLLALGMAVFAAPAEAQPRTHTVAAGQTLGKIAKRYNVSIAAICTANGMQRRDKLREGQRLLIPDADDTDGTRAAEEQNEVAPPPSERPRTNGGAEELSLPRGHRAYFYEPTGAGRLAMKPLIVYLHGRGGRAEDDCKKWSRVARQVGWLVCPEGPSPHGNGRAWDNNWLSAHQITMAAVDALRQRYGRRVQLYGNTLIGFSEGAYAAMNVGVREPQTFNRWMILAATTQYWGGAGLEALGSARDRVRRVYLITGGHDEVVDGTRAVEAWLKKAQVPTKVSIPSDMGHELALERKPFLYSQALRWLNSGEKPKPSKRDDA